MLRALPARSHCTTTRTPDAWVDRDLPRRPRVDRFLAFGGGHEAEGVEMSVESLKWGCGGCRRRVRARRFRLRDLDWMSITVVGVWRGSESNRIGVLVPCMLVHVCVVTI